MNLYSCYWYLMNVPYGFLQDIFAFQQTLGTVQNTFLLCQHAHTHVLSAVVEVWFVFEFP